MASDYFKGLEFHVMTRFREKISFISNIDPYILKPKDFKAVKPEVDFSSLALLPKVRYGDIYNYLIDGISPFTKESLRNYKNLGAYNNFLSGFVRDVLVKAFNNFILVKATVMHSQRMNEVTLKPWVVTNLDGMVKSGHCTCIAGLDESCSHVASLLFYIDYGVELFEKKTVTGVKAYWVVPTMKEVTYAPVSEMNVDSALARKKKADYILNNDSPPKAKSSILLQNKVPKATNETHNKLAEKLFKHGVKSSYFRIDRKYQEEYIPKYLDDKYPVVLTELFDESKMGLDLDSLKNLRTSTNINFSEAQADRVENQSKCQASSKIWHHFRAGRITASNFHRACHSDPLKPSISLINLICYPNARKLETEATKWGKNHEATMIHEYVKIMNENHVNFKYEKAGLCLNVAYPHLGASPDGFVSCDCCGKGLVEVKCPFSLKDKSYKDGVSSSQFCLDPQYTLKKKHPYFSQVQAQLFITKRLYADFCVWTNLDFHTQRLYPHEDFWKLESEKAETFFKTAIFPQLVGKFYTKDPTFKENGKRKARSKPTKKSVILTPLAVTTNPTKAASVNGTISPMALVNIPLLTTASVSIPSSMSIPLPTTALVTSSMNNPLSTTASVSIPFSMYIPQSTMPSVTSSMCTPLPTTALVTSSMNNPLSTTASVSIPSSMYIPQSTMPSVTSSMCTPLSLIASLSGDDESDEDEGPWCYCQMPESGKMIFCEGLNCAHKWYHTDCLKIKKIPKGKWYCKECNIKQMQNSSKKRRLKFQ